MAKYRLVDTKIWEDNYILELDPSMKLLFVYFLTNSNTNIAGIYEIAMRKVAMETGFDREAVQKMIGQLAADDKLYYIEGHIIIRNFLRYQTINKSVEDGVQRVIGGLPERLRKFFILNDDGLYLDARELGGKISGLDKRLSTLWVQAVPTLGGNLTRLNQTILNLTQLDAPSAGGGIKKI